MLECIRRQSQNDVTQIMSFGRLSAAWKGSSAPCSAAQLNSRGQKRPAMGVMMRRW